MQSNISHNSSVVKTLTGIRDGKHEIEVCKQNCTENGKTFNHPPHLCSYHSDDIKNLMHYKKIEIEVLPPQVWAQHDAKAMKVAEFDFKSTLAKERELELAMGLRTDDDIKELVNHLENM